jgi:hypothetical protein
VYDPTDVNWESFSKEIDESESQAKNHDEQRMNGTTNFDGRIGLL